MFLPESLDDNAVSEDIRGAAENGAAGAAAENEAAAVAVGDVAQDAAVNGDSEGFNHRPITIQIPVYMSSLK